MGEKINRRLNMLKAYHHEDPWWIPSDSDQQFFMPLPVMGEAALPGHSVDWYGVPFYWGANQPGPMPDYDFPFLLEEVGEWEEKVTWPDLDAPEREWKAGAEKDLANWDSENKVLSIIMVNGLWERFHAFLGMENAFCAFYEDPEATKALLERIADYKVDQINHFGKYYHPDKVQFHDDYGTERGLMLSIDMWREFIKPNLKKVIDAAHANGIVYEHHSCGKVVELFEDFKELGIDAWNPVQEVNGPVELIKNNREVTFVCGFNARNLEETALCSNEEKQEWIYNRIQELKDCPNWIAAPYNCRDNALFCEQNIWKINKPKYDALGLTGKPYEMPGEEDMTGGITNSANESFKDKWEDADL